jgi:hypothetical protein
LSTVDDAKGAQNDPPCEGSGDPPSLPLPLPPPPLDIVTAEREECGAGGDGECGWCDDADRARLCLISCETDSGLRNLYDDFRERPLMRFAVITLAMTNL